MAWASSTSLWLMIRLLLLTQSIGNVNFSDFLRFSPTMKAATTNLFFVPLLLLNSIMFVKSFTQIARRSSSSIISKSASIQRTSAVSYTQQQLTSPLTTRYMSSPSEEQTSVVDTCREKIVKALETDDVKVLGTYLRYVSIAIT